MSIRYWLLVLALVSLKLSAMPEIQHWQTNKGTRVLFVEAHELPILDIKLIFDAGSARDGKHKGLAALTSRLLDQGANGLDADQISSDFESVGAVYSSVANKDSNSVGLRMLVHKNKVIAALENLKRVISRPDFPMAAVELQRKRILLNIQKKQQLPARLAEDAFYSALYGQHPYAVPVAGTERSVEEIERKDIVDFYRRYFVAANATLVMVGDINLEQAQAVAEELTGELSKGKRSRPLPKASDPTEPKTIALPHVSQQTHIFVGQLGIKRGDPDYFPLYVGNHILGGGGMVSRLFEEIREKRGLSYAAYSYFSPMREAGPFLAGLQTKNDQADDALAVLINNLRHFIESGPSDEELLASKKNITGGFPLRLDNNAKILNYIAMIGFYNLPLNYLSTFNKQVEAVTVAQIKDAFKRRIDPDKLITIMVGREPEQKARGS